MKNGCPYIKEYYESGIENGISCYQNYRWMPEMTIPMAMTIIDFLGIDREKDILDFGCAKGFLVKALRLLHRKAWGVDISEYALSCIDSSTRVYCGRRPPSFVFDICIAKDVLEHLSNEELMSFLDPKRKWDAFVTYNYNKIFAIIPLGDGDGSYIAPVNNLDITHKICWTEYEWIAKFESNGWVCKDFRYRIDGIKDSYYEKYPEAHGFFTLIRS